MSEKQTVSWEELQAEMIEREAKHRIFEFAKRRQFFYLDLLRLMGQDKFYLYAEWRRS